MPGRSTESGPFATSGWPRSSSPRWVRCCWTGASRQMSRFPSPSGSAPRC